MQIQVLLVAEGVRVGAVVSRSNIGSNAEVAKLQAFNGTAGKISEFLTVCKLFIKIRMRNDSVEKLIQWVLLYVQGGSVDIWKENVLEYLESGNLEYETREEFLADFEKEFGEGDEEAMKVAELKKIEQGNMTMEEFVQEFKRVARGSSYKEQLLIEEFKRGMNETIW